MVERIKLMTDYECYPLWGMDEVRNIDPECLPLSSETIGRLKKWAAWYDSTLDETNPIDSGFGSVDEEVCFNEEGEHIWRVLQKELGAEYEVFYFDSLKRKLKSA